MDDFDRGRDGRSTDIPSGRGVPPWMAQTLNFCSNCGTALRFGEIEGEDRHRLSCPDCGHIAYVNPRLVVTVFPITDDGRIVLLRRGIEPGLVFMPFHYGDDGDDDEPTAANRLTMSGWDPVSKQPHFKYAAVSIRRTGGAPLEART